MIDLSKIIEKAKEVSLTQTRTVTREDPILQVILKELPELVSMAEQKGVKLPFSFTVRELAIAAGAPADRKSQYYYAISQRVKKRLPPDLELVKEGGTVYIRKKLEQTAAP